MAETYRQLREYNYGFNILLVLHVLIIAIGLGAAFYMEHNGHVVTGMNNQIVWGLPHVFAVFLIVSASGALNLASASSVFSKLAYKRFARLSAILAIALLIGGLVVLLLDLGRPDRLIVAMTHYNFKSIFAWNIILYTGFITIVGIYLWTMMDKTVTRFNKAAGWGAFIWRIILTTGTGSIFGFLVAREAYDAAIMAPLFISSSFVYGMAFTVWVLITMCQATGHRLLTQGVSEKLRELFIIFIAAMLYFTLVHHLTNLYAAEHIGVERYILWSGSVFTWLFWGGHVFLGTVLPLLILMKSDFGSSRAGLTFSSILMLLGGMAHTYVIIIGGQSYPLSLFPGMGVTSTFQDGVYANYMPTMPELLLGLAGVSMAMFIVGFALKILPFLPAPVTENQ
ncbi:MAG: polysulfide reductase NrfD [bacterium]|nr:polysulfide reductase NrfD [bacterium]